MRRESELNVTQSICRSHFILSFIFSPSDREKWTILSMFSVDDCTRMKPSVLLQICCPIKDLK